MCYAVNWRWSWPFPTVSVVNSTVVGNARGVVTRHYNHPSDEYLDMFFRFHWETVRPSSSLSCSLPTSISTVSKYWPLQGKKRRVLCKRTLSLGQLKVKAEHLHGVQTAVKRPGMDHTV